MCGDPLPPNSEGNPHDGNTSPQDQEEDEAWQSPLPRVTKRLRVKSSVPFEASTESDMDIDLDIEQPTSVAHEEVRAHVSCREVSRKPISRFTGRGSSTDARKIPLIGRESMKIDQKIMTNQPQNEPELSILKY